MQTTLRINDELYREAKSEAAREGITLTTYLESALRLRLGKARSLPAGEPHPFRVYVPETSVPLSNDDLRRIADEEQERHDLAKLGISTEVR
jgi:hypothetical protein